MTHIRDKEGKLKRKMVKYLGAEVSIAYKKMVQATFVPQPHSGSTKTVEAVSGAGAAATGAKK